MSDRSHWDLPSIEPHRQNRGFHDWVTLIELVRDSWLAVYATDRDRARRVATTWFEASHSAFKRLALFAASKEECIGPETWVDWLLSSDTHWLWGLETRREVLRLFVLRGHDLTPPLQNKLESVILTGPPRAMYRPDLSEDEWLDQVDHSVWLFLAKLQSSGLHLRPQSVTRLREIESTHPQWELAANQSDEFTSWMSGTGDPDFEAKRDVEPAPRTRRELVKWLAKPPPARRPLYEDTWRDVCRTRFFRSLYALSDLARNQVWPAGRWQDALQVWSEDDLVARSWRYAASVVQTMPDLTMEEIPHGVTWWLEKASKYVDTNDAIFVSLCRRLLNLPLKVESGITQDGKPIERPVTEAINHPIGHVTQALLDLWFRREPNDGDGLPEDIAPLFTELCDLRESRFRHGRVLLASRLIALFRVDRAWTTKYLLPLFDWEAHPIEAKAAWEGFLWSPRLYQPLMIAFKSEFLQTARHYEALGEHAQQFATILTYAALGPVDGYNAEEWRAALAALPQEGLQESAEALAQALEGAADQREQYWKNRIAPFWQEVWPKWRDLATPTIAESLTRMAIASGAEFPAVLTAVWAWLRPIEHPHYVIHRLEESGLPGRFPSDALRLLALIINNQPWGSRELGQCLDQIATADPRLANAPNFQRLREYARKHGD